MAEAARGNMRPCGCHRGRPCTCEMGRREPWLAFACGECTNCLLNAKAVQRKRRPERKCLRHDEFVAEQLVDRLEIAPGCVLRMRRPDWDETSKSAFYTHMRQLRLGLFALRVQSAVVVEQQKRLRRKYNRDLLKAEEVLLRVEESRIHPEGIHRHRVTPDRTHVDSDVFDSHSKQLVPATTLLPELRNRLQAANDTITKEQRNLELVEVYVSEVAAKKLQSTIRCYQRARLWKRVWSVFREDVEWAASVTIQSAFRMKRCKRVLPFLRELKRERQRRIACTQLRRFFRTLCLVKRVRIEQAAVEEFAKTQAQRVQAVTKLCVIASKIVKRMTLWKWRQRQREATTHDERRALVAVITIQRHWRGLRERLNFHRIRYRSLLSKPVRELYDRFVIHGDLWRLLFEVDASFRRYVHREQDEQENAKIFVAEFVRDKRDYEDRIMHDWLTASALSSPIVKGAKRVISAFSVGPNTAEGFTLANAVINSPMAQDLKDSRGEVQSGLFPSDLPAHIIRLGMYEGFGVSEVVTVMRGLVAQGKRVDDPEVVLRKLKQRVPLMTNSWKPERIVRREDGAEKCGVLNQPQRRTKMKQLRRKPRANFQTNFLSDNMIDNIPGGLNGAIDHLLLVAGMKCFDPDVKQGVIHSKQNGSFVFKQDATADPWFSYQHASSSLEKIRREQVVHEALRPYILVLKKKHCFSGFDLLHNARGVDEVVSWGLPRPLVMSIYDVIEVLHLQSVHRSDRNLQRQIRVCAQFESFIERSKREKRGGASTSTPGENSSHLNPNYDRPNDSRKIADAIERDVLELPIRESEMPAKNVLFKAFFLLCDTNQSPNSPSNQKHPPLISRDNYDQFLTEIVMAQHVGDENQVKVIIHKRVEVASLLASESSSQLERLGVKCARHMKGIRHLQNIRLHDQLILVLEKILSSLPEKHIDHIDVGRLCPDRKQSNPAARNSIPPLLRKPTYSSDGSDDALCSINIPF